MDLTNNELNELFDSFGVNSTETNRVTLVNHDAGIITIPEGNTTAESVIVTTDTQDVEFEEVVENETPLEVLIDDNTTTRFKGAEWFETVRNSTVVLAGCGGIGSWATILLGRVKPANLILFDDDVIDSSNLAGQLYTTDMVGKAKVDAIKCLLNSTCNYYNCMAIKDKFHGEGNNIMICGFDNMAARKEFFTAWKENTKRVKDPSTCLFIDGRLNAEEYQVFAITGDNTKAIEKYETEYLFNDNEADEVICSYKQTSFCATAIASMMVNIFVNFTANSSDLLFPRSVPFKVYYDAKTLLFKSEYI